MASDKYDVIITAAAEEDLDQAVGYYLRMSGSLSAQRLMDRFDDVVAYLSDIPTAAARIGDTDLHWMPVGSYTLVFQIDQDACRVTILRMYYLSSNWREEIKGLQ